MKHDLSWCTQRKQYIYWKTLSTETKVKKKITIKWKMAKDEDIDHGPTTDTPTTPPPPAIGYPEHDGGGGRSSTDFVAAVTVAILAVIIVITCVLVARAIRKRRRARQGTRMDQRIPAISTGVMGTRTY